MASEKTENNLNGLASSRNIDQTMRSSNDPLPNEQTLETNETEEETLHTLISDIRNLFGASKPKIERNHLIDEVRLKAESLRKKKRRKAMILSVMRAGSALVLFLSLGLLQFNSSLYLFSVTLGCIILGLTTFLERGT